MTWCSYGISVDCIKLCLFQNALILIFVNLQRKTTEFAQVDWRELSYFPKAKRVTRRIYIMDIIELTT